jgi:ankyrin repeat protein
MYKLLQAARSNTPFSAVSGATAADYAVQDNAGRTPLFLVSQNCKLENVKTALNMNPSVVNTEKYDGNTPLMITALQTADPNGEIVIALILSGAEVNRKQSTTGNTALHFAAQAGNVLKAAILLLGGADLTITNSGTPTISRGRIYYAPPGLTAEGQSDLAGKTIQQAKSLFEKASATGLQSKLQAALQPIQDLQKRQKQEFNDLQQQQGQEFNDLQAQSDDEIKKLKDQGADKSAIRMLSQECNRKLNNLKRQHEEKRKQQEEQANTLQLQLVPKSLEQLPVFSEEISQLSSSASSTAYNSGASAAYNSASSAASSASSAAFSGASAASNSAASTAYNSGASAAFSGASAASSASSAAFSGASAASNSMSAALTGGYRRRASRKAKKSRKNKAKKSSRRR